MMSRREEVVAIDEWKMWRKRVFMISTPWVLI